MKLSVPGEWAAKEILTPLLGEIGNDIKDVYALSKDCAKKIAIAAHNKITDKNDGKKVNLRVARDVFWNGSFSDEAICAEYFGGILASSRSHDRKDDNGIHYNDVIKSLSSKQLQLHYVIYNSINKMLVNNGKFVNVGLASELNKVEIWFSQLELALDLKLTFSADLTILFKQGLISEYHAKEHKINEKQSFAYVKVRPTTFGILLYAIAHNKFNIWNQFSDKNFGDFEDIQLPKYYEKSLNDLLVMAGKKK